MVPSDKPVDRRPRQDRRRRCAQDMQHLSEMQAHFVAATGEFVGTFMFLFFAYATQLMVLDQTSSVAPPAMETVYVSLGYGFSLLVTVWAFYRISGGLFNPAVSSFIQSPSIIPFFRDQRRHFDQQGFTYLSTLIGCARHVLKRPATVDACRVSGPDTDHLLHGRRRRREGHVPR